MNAEGQPLISVIIPIYNAEPYLARCIESVTCQTYRNLEILLVNDGSTDGSLQICRAYEGLDRRVRLCVQENKGRVTARKTGVKISKGEYISFVDADDWIEKDMYEKIWKRIQQIGKRADIVAFGLLEEYGDRQIARRESVKTGFYEMASLDALKENILYAGYFFGFGMLPHLCDKVFKKEILLASGFMEMDSRLVYGEDAAAIFRMCLHSCAIQVLDITPYHYRQNNYTNGLKTLQVGQANFCRLFQEFQNSIVKCRHREIYERQIFFYFWFVLLLRQFENLQTDGSLFPFPESVLGKKIILYGAGGFGIEVYKYIKKVSCCEVVGWVDREYASEDKKELPLESPLNIYRQTFDYILIAVLNERTAGIIKEEFEKKGIPSEKIQYIAEKCLKGEKLPEWLTEYDEKNQYCDAGL